MTTTTSDETKSVQSSDDAQQYMLTTVDNPYNPFTQYDQWYGLDEALGHHSTALLARYTITSDDLSNIDQEISVLQGMNDLIHDNPLGIHKLVTKSDF